MTGKILVVDDDPLHLLCVQEILEEAGHEVVVHRGAFGATDAVRVHAPDLVLLDVNMPALPGTSLVTVLRSRPQTREVPILLYSSNDEHVLREDAERLGLEGWIGKGDPDELRRKVSRCLADRAAGSPRLAGH